LGVSMRECGCVSHVCLAPPRCAFVTHTHTHTHTQGTAVAAGAAGRAALAARGSYCETRTTPQQSSFRIIQEPGRNPNRTTARLGQEKQAKAEQGEGLGEDQRHAALNGSALVGPFPFPRYGMKKHRLSTFPAGPRRDGETIRYRRRQTTAKRYVSSPLFTRPRSSPLARALLAAAPLRPLFTLLSTTSDWGGGRRPWTPGQPGSSVHHWARGSRASVAELTRAALPVLSPPPAAGASTRWG